MQVQLETPGGRGYSTQFVDHEGLLHKFARKGFARLQAAGVSWVDYEEVFGQMQLYFVQAEAKFEAGRGWTFAAYLGRVCINNFNKWAADLIEEQMGLGLLRISDTQGGDEEGSEDRDFYETHTSEQDESPEEIIERYDYIHKTRSSLSRDAAVVVRELAAPSQDLLNVLNGRDATIAAIGRFLNYTPARIKKVKQELSTKFGVAL
jgi:hypothetical protein